jgi:hypothetical protein
MAEVGRAISLGLAPGGASIWDSSAPNDFDGEVQYATARLNKFVKEALASSALQKGNVQEFSVNTNGCGLLDPKLWNIAAPLLVACAPHLLRLTLQWIPDIEQLPMFPQLQALIIKHDETSAFYEWLHPQFNETKFAPNPKLRNECWKSLASRFPRLIELELPYEDDLAMVVHFPHLHCFRGHWLRISRDSLHHLLPHKNLDILGLINVSRDDDAHDEKVLQQNLDVICELLSRNTLIRLVTMSCLLNSLLCVCVSISNSRDSFGSPFCVQELETDTIGGCKLFCSNGLERILSGIGSSICLASLTLDLREDYHLHAKGLIRALETNSGLSEISLTLGSSKHPALIEALCCHRSLTYLVTMPPTELYSLNSAFRCRLCSISSWMHIRSNNFSRLRICQASTCMENSKTPFRKFETTFLLNIRNPYVTCLV